jgi:glycosyltransferase involved in cell wall biosynthesis
VYRAPDSARHRRALAVLFHESEVLGAGVSVLRALDLLATHGWTASGWFPGPGPLLQESAGALSAQGLHERPLAFSSRGWRRPPGVAARLLRSPGYLRAFRRWLEEVRPQLVHANSLLMLPEATLARTAGFPVALQVHELPPPGRKRDATLRWASAVADVLIAVATPVAEMLREKAGATPVVIVRNGVPEQVPDRGGGDGSIVGTVGYVSRTKGTDVFLRAAELALLARPDLRFEHVGQARLWGDDDFDAAVEELAASEALRDAVTLRGSSAVADELVRWEIFVLASRREAFPLSTLEAMAAGLPVIATHVGGLPEQISHLETGVLVPPDRPDAIADWIVRLHDDPALRARLGQAARAHVRASFTLAAQAEGLNGAYEIALLRSRRRSSRLPYGRGSASR